MPLAPSEDLTISVGIVRGLEADLIRAEILAEGDDSQKERVEVLKKQIAAAEKRVAELEPVVQAEAEAAEERALLGQPPLLTHRTDEWYARRSKEFLHDWADARALEPAKSWTKEKLIEEHKAQDARDAQV